MQKCGKLINEILGQIYQDEQLQQCLRETVSVEIERMRLLHYIVMNYDCLSKTEIREQAYCYAGTIQEGELAARQIFLCLLWLADHT